MANYFIKIEDGPDVRRKLLESSKGSLQVLKTYQQLIVTRGQKLSLMAQLRRELKEITLLVNHAESLMPVITDKELEEMAPKKPVLKQPGKLADMVIVPKARAEPVKKESAVFVGPPMKKVVMEVPVPQPKLAAEPDLPAPRPKQSDLEKLEAQLAAVESKLSKM